MWQTMQESDLGVHASDFAVEETADGVYPGISGTVSSTCWVVRALLPIARAGGAWKDSPQCPTVGRAIMMKGSCVRFVFPRGCGDGCALRGRC